MELVSIVLFYSLFILCTADPASDTISINAFIYDYAAAIDGRDWEYVSTNIKQPK